MIYIELDWPPVLSDRGVPQRAVPAARLVNFAEKVNSSVFFVVTAVITDVIGHSEFLLYSHHMHAFMSLQWIDELQSDQSLWQSFSADFGESGSDFACTV